MEIDSKVEASKAITLIDAIRQRVLEVRTGDVCLANQMRPLGRESSKRCKIYTRNEDAAATTEKGITTGFQKYAIQNR